MRIRIPNNGYKDAGMLLVVLVNSVLRIRIYYYADADPDPGSKKCPNGAGSGSLGVKTKEEKLHQKNSTNSFKMT